jgi:hypothetical protein
MVLPNVADRQRRGAEECFPFLNVLKVGPSAADKDKPAQNTKPVDTSKPAEKQN